MGLDQYARAVKAEHLGSDADVDFKVPEGAETREIFYWRKHPNIQGWMENLYRTKGGVDEFNCVNVRLNVDDLDDLEQAVKADSLPETIGFFFGVSDPDDKEADLEFVETARRHLEEGYVVYYTSWW